MLHLVLSLWFAGLFVTVPWANLLWLLPVFPDATVPPLVGTKLYSCRDLIPRRFVHSRWHWESRPFLTHTETNSGTMWVANDGLLATSPKQWLLRSPEMRKKTESFGSTSVLRCRTSEHHESHLSRGKHLLHLESLSFNGRKLVQTSYTVFLWCMVIFVQDRHIFSYHYIQAPDRSLIGSGVSSLHLVVWVDCHVPWLLWRVPNVSPPGRRGQPSPAWLWYLSWPPSPQKWTNGKNKHDSRWKPWENGKRLGKHRSFC